MTTADEPAKEQRRAVIQDATFSRSVADSAYVVNLGRDIEIAFLQSGPQLLARVRSGGDEDQTERYESEAVLTEVSRIRIHPFGAMTMAIRVLEHLILDGALDTDRLIEGLNKVIDFAKSDIETDADE